MTLEDVRDELIMIHGTDRVFAKFSKPEWLNRIERELLRLLPRSQSCDTPQQAQDEHCAMWNPEKRIGTDGVVSERTNEQRAETARSAVLASLISRGECTLVDEDSVKDLFTDLLHLIDCEGMSGAQSMMDSAVMNWEAER